MPTTVERSAGAATNGCAHVTRLGPAVQDLRRPPGAGDAPAQPAVPEHPTQLVGEQEERRQRGGVVGLLGAAVLEGDAQIERGRHPTARGGDPFDALERRGGAAGQPQATVGAEALLRREVVDVDLGRGPRQPAGARGRVDDDQRLALRPAQIHHDAGRGLVVGERVDVDAGARRPAAGWVPGSLRMISGASRWGARAAASANLPENSPKTRCWLRRSISPNVATSQNAVVPPLPSTTSHPSGRREQLAQPGAHLADDVAHRCLPVATSPSSSGRPQPGPPWPRAGPSTDRSRSGRRAGSSAAGIWRVGAEVTVPA